MVDCSKPTDFLSSIWRKSRGQLFVPVPLKRGTARLTIDLRNIPFSRVRMGANWARCSDKGKTWYRLSDHLGMWNLDAFSHTVRPVHECASRALEGAP